MSVGAPKKIVEGPKNKVCPSRVTKQNFGKEGKKTKFHNFF